MAKYLPNPANLALFKVVMAPATGLKTEVTIYAADVVDAKSKVETMWGFPVLSGKPVVAQAAKEPATPKSKPTPPEVPSGFKYSVPDGVPLGLFTYCHAVVPTDEQAHGILLAFEQHVTQERLVEECTSNQRLLSDKPLDGVFAFVWRLARYMSGADNFIPSTAFIDLIDGTSKLTHLRVDPAPVKTIMQFLESKARELVDAMGRIKSS
jgi:hypothetical protein